MDRGKKTNTDKENKESKKKEEEDLDRELEQTFPASDPPSHSRPANDEKGIKKKAD